MVEGSWIVANAAFAAGQLLQPLRCAPKELAPSEVEITVTHCGICHAMIEMFAMNDVNPALDRAPKNDMRYRAVLVNEN